MNKLGREVMCRHNLIMVNEKAQESVLLEEYYSIENSDTPYYKDFRTYSKGYCNCDSFVGKFSERTESDFESAIEQIRKEKISLLYQIKELKLQKDYKEKLEQYDDIMNKYINLLRNNYMNQLDEEIPPETPLNISEENEKNRKVRDELKAYLDKNDLYRESSSYYLTKEEQDIKLKELNFDMPSRVIDEVVLNEEKEDYHSYKEEYESYVQLFTKLLEVGTDFVFSTVWNGPENLKIKKSVKINDLKIEDLIFLDIDEMLVIAKAEG